MRNKLVTAISLALALTTATAAPTAQAGPPGPPSGWPESPGVCDMLRVEGSAVGLAGMAQSIHGQGFDNMMDLTDANGCWD